MRNFISKILSVAMLAFTVGANAQAVQQGSWTPVVHAPVTVPAQIPLRLEGSVDTAIAFNQAQDAAAAREHTVLTAKTLSTEAATLITVTPKRFIAEHWAFAQKGCWYSYGGTSCSPGFDCSGLIMEAYLHAGFSLPRTTSEMQASGKLRRETYAEARPGDIILFGYPAYHAAMFTGHGMLFQSSEPGHRIGYAPIPWNMGPQFYRVIGANRYHIRR